MPYLSPSRPRPRAVRLSSTTDPFGIYERAVFTIQLRAEPGIDGIRSLRRGLKLLLRYYGLRCTSAHEGTIADAFSDRRPAKDCVVGRRRSAAGKARRVPAKASVDPARTGFCWPSSQRCKPTSICTSKSEAASQQRAATGGVDPMSRFPPDQQHGDEDLPPCCCRLR